MAALLAPWRHMSPVYRHGVTPGDAGVRGASMRDWTCAVDAFLTHRLASCTLCGAKGQPGLLTIYEIGAHSVATLLCTTCQRRDPQRVQLLALLEGRYGHGTT
jgi:hypothetical protein